MVAIVRSFGFPATELENLSCVPSTVELRPAHCPSCGVAAGPPGALRVVGHGFYRRQLLGLADAPEGRVIYVRRFLCLGCGKTASVLPDEVHPRRWYAGAAILTALVQYLILGRAARLIRSAFGAGEGARDWKSLDRWARQLLGPLWFWKAAELGHGGDIGARGRALSKRLLLRMLIHLGATEPYPPDVCAEAAQAAVLGTVHAWPERRLLSRTG